MVKAKSSLRGEVLKREIQGKKSDIFRTENWKKEVRSSVGGLESWAEGSANLEPEEQNRPPCLKLG